MLIHIEKGTNAALRVRDAANLLRHWFDIRFPNAILRSRPAPFFRFRDWDDYRK